jgi:Glycosyl transferase family 90
LTKEWTITDDIDLMERARTRPILLSSDKELQARVAAIRKESSDFIKLSSRDFAIRATDAAFTSHAGNGSVTLVRVLNQQIEFVLGREVHDKLQRKKDRQAGESMLQRLIISWVALGYYFSNTSMTTSFFMDFSDLAQHSEPCMAFCSNRTQDHLVPDPFFLVNYGYLTQKRRDVPTMPWMERKNDIFWRGSTSGLGSFSDTDRFHYLSKFKEFGELINVDAAFSRVTPRINHPVSDEELAFLKRHQLLKDPVPKQAYADHRYLLDIDGNSNSWGGLFTSMLTGSVVVKCESRGEYRQWYYDRLQSGKNYFLLRSNLENINELAELMQDEQHAASIGEQGRKFALNLNVDCELKTNRSAALAWLDSKCNTA